MSKTTNISTMIVRHKPTFTDEIQSLQCWVRAFAEHYSADFVLVSITNIVKDIMSSNFMAPYSRVIYTRYNRPDMMMIKHHGLFPLLRSWKRTIHAANTLSITHLDDSSLYVYSEKIKLLMI